MRYAKLLTTWLFLSLICLLAACGSDSPAPVAKARVSLQAQYSSAVADARTAEPAEISRYLTPVTNDNPNLIWENGVKGSRLLVVTWPWVSPQNLFRPCPDTEISDTACETSFPADLFCMLDLNNKDRATVGPEYGVFKSYLSWFTNQASYSYTTGLSPYPWTRLGYTYDWGSSNHIGLSEFVLHGRKEDGSGIAVGIKSVKTTVEYFAR